MAAPPVVVRPSLLRGAGRNSSTPFILSFTEIALRRSPYSDKVQAEALWTAMSQALDESRRAFAKAIELTAKTFNEAAKG